MFKKLLFALFLISSTIQSQTSVTGLMEPALENYEWIILYQLKGANQLYITNVDVIEGKFKVDFPENTSKGMYRLMYDMNNGGFVDFLYNSENIELKFDPTYPAGTLEFISSEENKTFNAYRLQTDAVKRKLDSLQLAYFKIEDEKQKGTTAKLYEKTQKQYHKIQLQFNEKSEGQLANNFIKSSHKYYSPKLFSTPQEYLNSEKQHYFDFVDFNNTALSNSIFFSEKVIDYVFYLNSSDDKDVQNVLYKNAVNEVVKKLGDNSTLKSELLTTLLYTFAQIENTVLIDYIINDFYNKLPTENKNAAVINEIQSKVKLTIGKTAPDFSFDVDKKSVKLSELENEGKYILVFWSTSCSHCLEEVPQLYEYTKDNEEIHVIAVALEDDELGFNHHTQIFENWTNVLGLQKWQNPIAREYEITSTPTYFVLDKDKKIISKPDYFEDVKDFFEKD